MRVINFIPFLCLVILFNYNPAFSQFKSKQIQTDFYDVLPKNYFKMTQRINDELFVVYSKNKKGESAYVGYDQNLKEVFRIAIPKTNYSTYITYHQLSDQLLTINIDHKRGSFEFTARTFNSKGELQKQEKIALPGSESDLLRLKMAEDGSYFCLVQKTGNKGLDRLVTVYDINLSKKYTSEIKANSKEKEEFETYRISNQGNMVFASSTDSKFTFYQLNLQGKISETLTVNKMTEGKEVYGNYLMEVAGDRVVFAATKYLKNALKAIDVFDVSFSSKKITTHQSKEFSEGYIGELYDQIKEEDVLNKKFSLFSNKSKRPKHLAAVYLQHLFFDDENIYLISESSYSEDNSHNTTLSTRQRIYYADDILVCAFGKTGNKWNSIIGRRMSCGDGLLGGWAGLLTNASLHGNKLHVTTSEYNEGTQADVSSYLRTVDTQTGKVSVPQRLLAQSFWTNVSFNTWLSPNQLVIFRTNNVTNNRYGDYSLNIVNVEP